MKNKELIAELQRLDPEADTVVRIDGRPLFEGPPPPFIGLERGHYKLDRVTQGGIYPSDISLRLVE